MFMELTSRQGYAVVVNMDHVLRMCKDIDLENSTMLHLSDGTKILVQETLDTIMLRVSSTPQCSMQSSVETLETPPHSPN